MLTNEQRRAVALIDESKSLLLTGKAGTGKTYVVNSSKKSLNSRGIVYRSLSFTASSAKLVGGNTIHSCLITPQKMLPCAHDMSKEMTKSSGTVNNIINKCIEGTVKDRSFMYINLITSLARTEVFFIDEISMVSPELLYAFLRSIEMSRMIFFTKRFRKLIEDPEHLSYSQSNESKSKKLPVFVFTGDFFQIPPVNKPERGTKRKYTNMEDEFKELMMMASRYLKVIDKYWNNDDNITIEHIKEHFGKFEESFKNSIRSDVDLRNFTLPMLKQMTSVYSSWVLRSIKETRYVFDKFTDLVGPSYSEIFKRNPYEDIEKKCSMESVILSESQRQKDDISFLEILDCLRLGAFCVWNPQQAKFIHPEKIEETPQIWPLKLKNLLKSRVDAKVPDWAVRIYLKNEDASNYNNKELENLSGSDIKNVKPVEYYVEDYGKKSEVRFKFEEDNVSEGDKECIRQFKNDNPYECKELEIISFKIGAKVIVTRNIDKSKGIINGLTGTVISFREESVEIRTENSQRVWIEMTEQVHQIGTNKYYCIKYIPIILGWAITSCRCQGMTLSYAEIHLSLQYTCGHIYTAISRLKSLDSLSIILPISKAGKTLSLDFFMETQAFSCHPIVYQLYR